MESRSDISYKLWVKLLRGEFDSNYSEFYRGLASFSVPVKAQYIYLPAIIQIFRISKEFDSPLDRQHFLEIMRTFESVIESSFEDSVVINFGRWNIFTCFRIPASDKLKNESGKNHLRTITKNVLLHHQFDYSCYVGFPSAIDKIPSTVRYLKDTFKKNVLPPKDICGLRDISATYPVGIPFSTEDYVSMLCNCERAEFNETVEKDILKRFGSTYEASSSYRFYQNMIQACYSALYQNRISADSVLDEMGRDINEESTVRSAYELIRFCHSLGRRTIHAITERRNAFSTMEQIKEYITGNIENGVSRASVANYFRIHPDYLSHMFMKETGKPFSKYLIDQKIDRAKHLLSSTPEPITDIALHLGYSTSSYFTAAFKKETGITPASYRSQFRKGPESDN